MLLRRLSTARTACLQFDVLVKAWSTLAGVDGVWLAESKTTDLTGDSEFLAAWNGGGLYGYATVINVPQGASFGYDAIAIADHVAAGSTGSDMHYQPGDIRPNFGDSALDTSSIISVNGAAVTLDFNGDYPAEATERVQALNSTIMASEIYNDYVTDSAIAATRLADDLPHEGFPSTALSRWSPSVSCGQNRRQRPTELAAVDREESTPPPPPAPGSSGPDFSPAPPPTRARRQRAMMSSLLRGNIVQFGTETAMGSSTVAVGECFLDAPNGWATISMMPADLDATLKLCGTDADITTVGDQTNPCDRSINAGDAELFGLPVVGFAVQKYVNGSANSAGALANYGMATEHKSCAAGSGTAANDC